MPDIQISLHNLEDLPLEPQSKEVDRLARIEAEAQFDLASPRLFRISILRLGEQEHVMLIAMHHIVSDAWSRGIFGHELEVLYEAYRDGKASPLADLAIHYSDYAAWQREWLSGEVLGEQLTYWREQLRDLSVLELPTDWPRAMVSGHKGASEGFRLSAELTKGLRELTQREGVTLFMTLLAAYQVLLARYTGQEDIAVGSPIANRNQPETEGLIGFLVNTLVLRTKLSGDPTFRDVLQRVRETTLEGYAHQDLPFEKLVAELNPQRDMSRSPLFQVMLILQNAAVGELRLPGLQVEREETERATTKFDLTMILEEEGEQLRGSVEYDAGLFEKSRIERMVGHWEMLLAGIVTNPGQRIRDLPLLKECEQQQLIDDWNRTEVKYPKDKCIHHFFEEQAARTPKAVAVVHEQEVLTYEDLNQRANQLARHLRKMGVGPEVRVGLCTERSPRSLSAILAIWKAGAIYCPLDPREPDKRLFLILDDFRPRVLIGPPPFLQRVHRFPALKVALDSCLNEDTAALDRANGDSTAPAYVAYTSGTTGKPKGVVVDHPNLLNTVLGLKERFRFSEHDSMLCLAFWSFDISLVELTMPLVAGGVAHIATEDEVTNVSQLVHKLDRITVIHAVPGLMREIVEEIEDRQGHSTAVRLALTGGDSVPADLLQKMRHTFPRAEINVLYGPTETAIVCCAFAVPPSGALRDCPIGRPLDNVQVRLYDANQNLVPVGFTGEIYIGGNGVARGYWNNDLLTHERFVSVGNHRFYRSGDLAQWSAGGDLYFLGRTDNQLKIHGCRVEIEEVESIVRQSPRVREAVVLAMRHGIGDNRLVAYVVIAGPSDGVAVPEEEICEFLRKRLPECMVPAVVRTPSIPRTMNGKPDRLQLASLPMRALAVPARAQTPTEETLKRLWAEILGSETFGLDDSFFAVGGHSLLGLRLIAKVRRMLGVELSLREVFLNPTVRAMARRIELIARQEPAARTALARLNTRPAKISLSGAQRGLWIQDRLQPDNPAYNMSIVVRLLGSLKVPVLEEALNEILRRHESLRTKFQATEREPVQIVEPRAGVSLSMVDLRGKPLANRLKEMEHFVSAEVAQPFDLNLSPILRATLLQIESDHEHVLVLTTHHIVFDGWSLEVLIRELSTLYDGILENRGICLDELPLQYADYAIWQSERMRDAATQDHLAYWQQKLGTNTPALELSTDWPYSKHIPWPIGEETRVLSELLTRKLKHASQQEQVTLFQLLLATFHLLLHRHTRQETTIVGVPVAGREQLEVQGLIGNFVNILPIRADFGGVRAFRDLLGQVRSATLEAYLHQEFPFAALVQELGCRRDGERQPIVQATFACDQPARLSAKCRELNLDVLCVKSGGAKFEMSLAVVDSREGLQTSIGYRSDLFHARRMAKLLERFETLLEGVAADPGQPIENLRMLTLDDTQGCDHSTLSGASLSQRELEDVILEIEPL